MNCCDQNCHQGDHCPIRATRRVKAGGPPPADLPVQYSEPEPIGSDWVDMAMLSVAALLLLAIGFVAGRAWG